MFVFVDTDCLRPPLDAVDDGRGGISGFEAVLHGWPETRLVLTTERRHWTTLDALRAEFALKLRPRIAGTIRFHGALAEAPRPPREHEIAAWLRSAGADDADWLAVDDRADDEFSDPRRHLHCRWFGAAEAQALHERLLQRARLHETVRRALAATSRAAPRLGA